MSYKHYNPNNKKAADCVVRALMAVTGESWEDIFDMLCEVARRKKRMPGEKEAYGEVLEDAGFRYVGIKIKRGESRQTAGEFAATHQTGRYVLSLANHLLAVVDGDYMDSWDSGYLCVYAYWYKE